MSGYPNKIKALIISFLILWSTTLLNPFFGFKAFYNDHHVMLQHQTPTYMGESSYTIRSIGYGDQEIPVDDLELNGWETSNTASGYPLTITNAEPDNSIKLKATPRLLWTGLEIDSHFGPQQGILIVNKTQQSQEMIVAHAEESKDKNVQISFITGALISQVVLFVSAIFSLAYLIQSYQKSKWNIFDWRQFIASQQGKSNLGLLAAFLFGLLLLIIGTSFRLYDFPLSLLGINLVRRGILNNLLFIFLIFAALLNFLQKYTQLGNWLGRALFLINPLITMRVLEAGYNPERSAIDFFYIGITYTILLAIQMFIFLLFRSKKVSAAVLILLGITGGTVNQILIDLRETPLLPTFLGTLDVAFDVADNIDIYLKPMTINAHIMAIVWLMALQIPTSSRSVVTLRKYFTELVVYAFGLVLLVPIFNDKYFPNDLAGINWWRPHRTYYASGTVYSFYNILINQRLEAPDGYDVAKVSQVLSESATQTTATKEKPNIIMVQSESLADYHGLNEQLYFNKDPLKHTKAITEDFIQGQLYVSTYGGGTIKTEYEALTANPLSFFPRGSDPFWQYVEPDSHSIATLLKDQDYRTIAAHPMQGSNYSRTDGYPNLGFDESYFIEHYEGMERVRYFVSDAAMFKEIQDVLIDEQKDPVFYFAVTMQNHSSYDTGFTGEITYQDENLEGVSPTLLEFVNLVNESDKAFKEFTEFLTDFSEPTIVLLYSDHLPPVHNEAMDLAQYTDLTELEAKFLDHEVPFYVWANFEIPQMNDVKLSANYLSPFLLDLIQDRVKMSDYYHYLINFKKDYPVITTNFIQDNEFNFIDDQDVIYSDREKEFNQIIYGNVSQESALSSYYE